MKIEYLQDENHVCYYPFNTLIVLQHALFTCEEDRPLNWMTDYLGDDTCWQDTLEMILELAKKNESNTLYLFCDADVFVTSSDSVTYGILAKDNEDFVKNKFPSMIDALRAVRARHASKKYLSTNFVDDREFCRQQGLLLW